MIFFEKENSLRKMLVAIASEVFTKKSRNRRKTYVYFRELRKDIKVSGVRLSENSKNPGNL